MRASLTRRKIGLVAAAAVAVVAGWSRFGPLPDRLFEQADAASTIVVDRHGAVLYEARSPEGARRGSLDPWRLPAALAAAAVAAEDRRFWLHPGVDPLSLVRAAVRNARARRVVEGGSTITQQAAKLLLARGHRRRGVMAKIEEAIVALRLEHRLTKQEILALYLNLAPYGNQIVGATRAAQIYFGVPPSMLTTAQAAFLAGLPHRPSAYNPYRDRASGLRRQHAILSRMAAQGYLTPEQAASARAERLAFAPHAAAFRAPHFVEMVLAAPGERSDGGRGGRSGPRRIETTLDSRLQTEIEGIVRSHRARLTRHGAHNAAIVVLDNRRSEWLAWEGSGDYTDDEHGGNINGPLALRQPGSALKPFTYALGFETGGTPAAILPDVPASFPTAEEGIVYTPRNYDGTFHGPLRMRKALAGSQNVPAVALASRIGVADLLHFLRQAGFTTLDKTAAHYGLGLTLGNAEVRLAELVAAYAAIARGGVFVEPHFLATGTGRANPRRILSPRAAFWVTDVLSDHEARAYVFGRGGSLEFPFPVAVKTGTSQAYRDNWAIGYTREVTVGVWVGNFDRRALIGSSGMTGSGPLFHAVMLAAQRRASAADSGDIVERPADLGEQTVCELSGMRAGTACPIRRVEWLPATFSVLPCDWHHYSEHGLLTLWPPEYQRWARDRGLPQEPAAASMGGEPMSSLVPRARGTAPATRTATRLTILSPPAGATYLIDPTLRPEFQSLPLRAGAANGRIEWRVNGRVLASTAADAETHWPLRRGEHRITARDAAGRVAEASITVR